VAGTESIVVTPDDGAHLVVAGLGWRLLKLVNALMNLNVTPYDATRQIAKPTFRGRFIVTPGIPQMMPIF
jgi:hypothetical protein